MSDEEDGLYGAVMGGSLKLKGAKLSVKGDKKKRKKKAKKEKKKRRRTEEGDDTLALAVPEAKAAEEDDGPVQEAFDEFEGLTPAQIRFMKKQREKEVEEIKSMATKSHREKVDDLNQYLASLPAHFDIPKVASAGNG